MCEFAAAFEERLRLLFEPLNGVQIADAGKATGCGRPAGAFWGRAPDEPFVIDAEQRLERLIDDAGTDAARFHQWVAVRRE